MREGAGALEVELAAVPSEDVLVGDGIFFFFKTLNYF